MTAVVSVTAVVAAASVATILYLSGGWVYESRDERDACQVHLRVNLGQNAGEQFFLQRRPDCLRS